MTAEPLKQGDLRLLEHPVAQELLTSAIPARVGYNALDGSPRVTPMWFTWNGTELVFGAAGTSPKVKAIQTNERVAVTIDTDTNPYKVLLIRGSAQISIVEGAVEEYADAGIRYMGPTHGTRFRDYAKATMTGMVRITVKPAWVAVIDFQTRLPQDYS